MPGPSAEVEASRERFQVALARLKAALEAISRLPDPPSAKQMGMAVASLIFRGREVSAVGRSLPADADPVHLATPGYNASRPDVVFQPWPIRQGEWLAGRCAALYHSAPAGALVAANELLQGLPAVQEEITRLVYREDLAA